MLAIVDYGMGNLRSVANALECVGVEARITADPAVLADAGGVIVPGVGAFADGMANLRRLGLVEVLRRQVLEAGKPYLGICLGLQFLAERSYENGVHEGLGFVAGEVVRLASTDPVRFKIPHMGWNEVALTADCPLFTGLDENRIFYFVHSYQFRAAPQYVTAVCRHGGQVVAAVRKDNIFAVPFHPEKSQGIGLRVLENFAAICGEAVAVSPAGPQRSHESLPAGYQMFG